MKGDEKMKKSQEIIGRPVFSIVDGKKIGQVKDLPGSDRLETFFENLNSSIKNTLETFARVGGAVAVRCRVGFR